VNWDRFDRIVSNILNHSAVIAWAAWLGLTAFILLIAYLAQP